MEPVLAAATGLSGTQSKALEHGALLLEGIVIALAAAKPVLEVLVVLVVGIGFFGVHAALQIGFGVGSQRAWTCRRHSLRTAVACEVALLKDLDESMLAVALY